MEIDVTKFLLHVKVKKNVIKRIEWKSPLNKWQSCFILALY